VSLLITLAAPARIPAGPEVVDPQPVPGPTIWRFPGTVPGSALERGLVPVPLHRFEATTQFDGLMSGSPRRGGRLQDRQIVGPGTRNPQVFVVRPPTIVGAPRSPGASAAVERLRPGAQHGPSTRLAQVYPDLGIISAGWLKKNLLSLAL